MPPASNEDPFRDALFDRIVELSGYLCKYTFCQIADANGFLSVSEMYQRVQRASYAGTAITNPSFLNWVKWMEFLGRFKQVGFRHKLTETGIEGYRYLEGLDDADLLGGQGALSLLAGLGEEESEEDAGESEGGASKPYLTAEELGAGSGEEAVPVALPPAGQPSGAAASGGGSRTIRLQRYQSQLRLPVRPGAIRHVRRLSHGSAAAGGRLREGHARRGGH